MRQISELLKSAEWPRAACENQPPSEPVQYMNKPVITRYEQYNQYLQSDHWQNLRMAKLEMVKRTCEHCGATGSLDCHHIRYRDLYDVQLSDLAALCRDCHEWLHSGIRKTGPAETLEAMAIAIKIGKDLHGQRKRRTRVFRLHDKKCKKLMVRKIFKRIARSQWTSSAVRQAVDDLNRLAKSWDTSSPEHTVVL